MCVAVGEDRGGTNLFLRTILQDDPHQARIAEAVLRRADPLVILTPVLFELVWTLNRRGFSRRDVHATVAALVASDRVEVDRPVVDAGLALLMRGGDFADGCLLEQARAAHCQFVSFDLELLKLSNGAAIDPSEIA